MTVDLLLERLQRVKRSGDGWEAQCPAHEDRHASLTVGIGAEGRVLVHCHAGCSAEDVVRALGLELSDLFSRDEQPPTRKRPRKLTTSESDLERFRALLDEQLLTRLGELRGWESDTIRKLGLGFDGQRVVFPYRDAMGVLVGVGRYQPNPDRRNGTAKLIADTGSRRTLFPPPETLNGAATVFLVEGEADAVRLISCGVPAVAYPGVHGWRREDAERFRGRRVIVTPDCDPPGRTAGQRIARDLAAVGIATRLLDLDPAADDGFDASDFLSEARTASERDEARAILTRCTEAAPAVDHGEPPKRPEPPQATRTRALRFAPLREFSAQKEASAEPLVGTPERTVAAADSIVLAYGDGGASKTTLTIDAAAHWAAGIPWLGIETPRPLREVVIENEGPRGKFREKLDRKSQTWAGPPFEHNVHVLEEPWGGFSFADEAHREQLAAFVIEHEIDLALVGPLVTLGAVGGGTPEEVSAFESLILNLRARVGRPLALLIVHHENKAGDVSGAWERLPDTLLHVRLDGKERTRLHWRKARWASELHDTKWTLRWITATEGFEREPTAETSAVERAARLEAALPWIVAYVSEHPGLARTKVEEAYKDSGGVRNDARKAIDAQLRVLAAWAANGASCGEPQPLLATTTGEARNGTYLIPFSDACSPLAGTLLGEHGEHPSPTSETPAERDRSPLADPLKGEAEHGEQRAGAETQHGYTPTESPRASGASESPTCSEDAARARAGA